MLKCTVCNVEAVRCETFSINKWRDKKICAFCLNVSIHDHDHIVVAIKVTVMVIIIHQFDYRFFNIIRNWIM